MVIILINGPHLSYVNNFGADLTFETMATFLVKMPFVINEVFLGLMNVLVADVAFAN